MDTSSKESPKSLREFKREQLSHRVWEIESEEPKLVKVNSDGSIPYDIMRRVKENVLYPTDYVNKGKRTFLLKINSIVNKINI